MMTKEEKAIRNIRRAIKQRMLRIMLVVGVVAFLIWCTVFAKSRGDRLDAKITPEHVRSMASYENPKHEIPILFSRFYTLSACRAKLKIYEFYFSVFTGLFIALLIIEIAGVLNGGRYLTLSMWERIETLEAEISRLRSQPDTEDQHPPADAIH